MPKPRDAISTTLTQVFASVKGQLHRTYHPSFRSVRDHLGIVEGGNELTNENRSDHGDAAAAAAPVLDALNEDDWDNVLYPTKELRPYLLASLPFSPLSSHLHRRRRCRRRRGSSEASGSGDDEDNEEKERVTIIMESYVKCRCAELPMRLQTEALQIQQHEHTLRRHMRELVALSEFMSLCGDTVPTLRGNACSAEDLSSSNLAGSLSAEAVLLVAPEENERRLARCQKRVEELERLIKASAHAKQQCCQRMVLMSAVVEALLDRVKERSQPALKQIRTE